MRRLLRLLLVGLLSAGLAHADRAQEAHLCGGAGGPEHAFAARNRPLATSPSDFRPRADIDHSRGVARAILGDHNGAIDDFSLALRNRPSRSDADHNRGSPDATLGHLGQGRSEFETARSLTPHAQKGRDSLSRLARMEPPRSEPLRRVGDPGRGAPPAQLVGDWGVDNTAMGAGETYAFRPDATYEHKIWQILPGTRRVARAEVGTYAVQGSRLTLSPQGGGVRTYTWRTGRDPYVGTPMLFLRDAKGTERPFYG
jgi:hypothetical protein